MFCTNCGNELSNEYEACSNCGEMPQIPIESTSEEISEQNNFNTYNDDESLQGMTKYNKPMSTAKFFFIQILLLISPINLFLILFWSFNKTTNKNLKAYARSKLIWATIITVVVIFIILTMAFMNYPISVDSFFKFIKNLLNK